MSSRVRKKPKLSGDTYKYKYKYRYWHKSKKYTPMPSPELTNSPNNSNSNHPENIKKPSPKIIPIDIDNERLKDLKKILESKDITDKDKHLNLRRITGACVTCAGISEYYLIYDLDGCSKIERYCSPCIEREKKRQEIIQ